MAMRRLGVYGDTLPVKKAKVVQPSDFAIAGMIAQTERKFDKAFTVRGMEEFVTIFGNDISSSFYGYESAAAFFNNVGSVDAKLIVKSHVGNTGSAIDAVAATRSVLDSLSAATITATAAYASETEYGVSGNRTAIKITAADRFSTTAADTALASAYTAKLTSVAGFKVGDLVRFDLTGGGSATAYHKITAVDESAKTITWTDAVLHASKTLAVTDVVAVVGFTVKTYRKSITGIETEVDIDRGKIVCTLEPEVTDYYVNNVFASSPWVKLADAASASALYAAYPATDANPVYLTSGADGTAASTLAHWSYKNLTAFDNLPVRILFCPETTLSTFNQAMETYAQGRDDTPKVIFNLPDGQTKAQLIVIGNGYQRSNRHLGVGVDGWIQIVDPFSTSPTAPYREIPNVGFVAGAWIQAIGQYGIHYVPAIKQIALTGAQGVSSSQTWSDYDRTDLAGAGINVIQSLTGIGIVIRNFFTFSTDSTYMFANGILMQDFIKVSAVDSLQDAENQPNTFDNILANKSAIEMFLYNLWSMGSTGNVRTGETFGQTFDSSGNPTPPETHFSVKADVVNNPQTSIAAGQQNLDTYFTFPTPAGSIKIGVGILILS